MKLAANAQWKGNMSQETRSTQARHGAGRSLRLPKLRADRLRGTVTSERNALRRNQYRELTRKHLGKLLDHLFAEFTGLHIHIFWAPGPAQDWAARSLPTACAVCSQLSGSPLRPGCRVCGPRQLARALHADGDGHQFTCRLGVRNYWFPLRIRGETVGIAYLQALDRLKGRQVAGGFPARAEMQVLSRMEFARAARLLRFVVQHVQTASLADLRKADLTSAGHAVLALEKEQARLHEVLQRHLPTTPQDSRRLGAKSHPEQIVHRLIECIEQNYDKAVTLRGCAVKLGMNAAYLSGLFSNAMGVPFKTHLTELRMAQAKRLLSDPTKHVSEVAEAVGYASENRFRIAFKKATGLSPKLWRETMQTSSS